MGQNKIEKQVKKHLEQREIQPSAHSWEQLSSRLDAKDKKGKPAMWWIGIAAGLAAGFLIYSLVFTNGHVADAPAYVETETPVKEENTPDAQAPAKEIQQIALEEPKVAKTSSGKSTSPEKVSTPVVKNQKEEPALASLSPQDPTVEEALNPTEETLFADKEPLSQKLEEILAEVALKEKETGAASNEEIDALLYKAAAQLSLQQKQASYTAIDAKNLLLDVEMELEQSFRERVFDLLKDGYVKARTAVANRSYP